MSATPDRTIHWDRPLFIVTAGRSGSRYLANMLNAHPQMALTYEAHLSHFFKITHELTVIPARKTKEVPPFQLFGLIGPHYAERFSKMYMESALELWRRFYLAEFADKPFTRWGDKITWPRGIIADLRATFAEAQFLHLVRDGRDYVVSARLWHERDKAKRPFIENLDFDDLCRRWLDVSADIVDDLQDDPRSLTVRYEQLISEPHAEAARVLAFLELPHTEQITAFIDQQASAIFEKHGTSKSPVASIGRWRSELDQREQARAQELMGEMLERLGYSPEQHP